MKQIPKWIVSFSYPVNHTSITIGLSREGIERSHERMFSLDIGDFKETQIQQVIEDKIKEYQEICDSLNRKVEIANATLNKHGFIDTNEKDGEDK